MSPSKAVASDLIGDDVRRTAARLGLVENLG
jgi:hypothetical protein